MKYLRLFENHDDYEASKGELETPNVAYDCENVHYLSDKKQKVGQLMFTDFQDYNLVDLYDFEDVNVPYSTAAISIESDTPVYLIFDEGAEFKFLINVDGEAKYRLNSKSPGTIISEINDELIEMLQEMEHSEKFMQLVIKNKGKWIIDSKDARIEKGIIYNDKTYWTLGDYSGGDFGSFYDYQSEDEESIYWFPIDPHGDYEEGEEVTVDVYNDTGRSMGDFKETATVTITERYALAMIM